jgi:hypothetical protein
MTCSSGGTAGHCGWRAAADEALDSAFAGSAFMLDAF